MHKKHIQSVNKIIKSFLNRSIKRKYHKKG